MAWNDWANEFLQGTTLAPLTTPSNKPAGGAAPLSGAIATSDYVGDARILAIFQDLIGQSVLGDDGEYYRVVKASKSSGGWVIMLEAPNGAMEDAETVLSWWARASGAQGDPVDYYYGLTTNPSATDLTGGEPTDLYGFDIEALREECEALGPGWIWINNECQPDPYYYPPTGECPAGYIWVNGQCQPDPYYEPPPGPGVTGDMPTTDDLASWEAYFGVPSSEWTDIQYAIYMDATSGELTEEERLQLEHEANTALAQQNYEYQRQLAEMEYDRWSQEWETGQDRLQWQDYQTALQTEIERQRSPLDWNSYWSLARGGEPSPVPKGYGTTTAPNWFGGGAQDTSMYNFPQNAPVYTPDAYWRPMPSEQPLPNWFTAAGGQRVPTPPQYQQYIAPTPTINEPTPSQAAPFQYPEFSYPTFCEMYPSMCGAQGRGSAPGGHPWFGYK